MKKFKTYIIPTLSESMGKCEICGKKDELRPYGKNGENVCFDCGMKDEKSALIGFKKQFK